MSVRMIQTHFNRMSNRAPCESCKSQSPRVIVNKCWIYKMSAFCYFMIVAKKKTWSAFRIQSEEARQVFSNHFYLLQVHFSFFLNFFDCIIFFVISVINDLIWTPIRLYYCVLSKGWLTKSTKKLSWYQKFTIGLFLFFYFSFFLTKINIFI